MDDWQLSITFNPERDQWHGRRCHVNEYNANDAQIQSVVYIPVPATHDEMEALMRSEGQLALI